VVSMRCLCIYFLALIVAQLLTESLSIILLPAAFACFSHCVIFYHFCVLYKSISLTGSGLKLAVENEIGTFQLHKTFLVE